MPYNLKPIGTIFSIVYPALSPTPGYLSTCPEDEYPVQVTYEVVAHVSTGPLGEHSGYTEFAELLHVLSRKILDCRET